MTATSSADRSQWIKPGIFAVAPRVHRVPLPLPQDGLRAVNVYVLEEPDGLVLVDSGWALLESREMLSEALASLDHGLGDIRLFLVTHVHRDHYTQAVALRREYGSRISLGEGEHPSLAAMLADPGQPLASLLKRLRACGAETVVKGMLALGLEPVREGDWELPDDWLARAELPLAGRLLEIVPTPGHTSGHVVFVDKAAGLMFAGDHVLPHITPSIGFEPVPRELALAAYIESLRTVRSMPDTMLLPAHGPVTQSVHARVDELLKHHEDRLDAALHATSRGAHTAYEVASRLAWTRRARQLSDLDAFNQALAVIEIGAHLDVLVSRGRLRMSTEWGVAMYAA